MKRKRISDLCAELEAGGYIGWPVGGVLREYNVVVLDKKSRADTYLAQSETYRCCQEGIPIWRQFKESRSKPGYLKWISEFVNNTCEAPTPILADLEGGVVRLVDRNLFACLEDVRRGLYFKNPKGELIQYQQIKSPTQLIAAQHTTKEIDEANPAKSLIGSRAHNGRRIQQNEWRENVLNLWGRRCVVSGLAIQDALRASHIMKYAKCSTTLERRDPHNGLALSGTLDLLFEHGYISFDQKGRLLISKQMSPEDCALLGLKAGTRIERYSASVDHYMNWHRANCFRD